MGQCFGQALDLRDVLDFGSAFEISGSALNLGSGLGINFISVFFQRFFGGMENHTGTARHTPD